jgi:hypothetical protein
VIVQIINVLPQVLFHIYSNTHNIDNMVSSMSAYGQGVMFHELNE